MPTDVKPTQHTPDTVCLETELRRLSKLETVSPYVQARLEDAADAIHKLVELLNAD